MTDEELAELYYRTTLELADPSGVVWAITPAVAGEDNPLTALAPFSDAFVLTAENPESSGHYSAEENAAATAALAHELDHSELIYRNCPGFGFDSDHVEYGFALLATPENRDRVRQQALEFALSYRQNAIFHLSAAGLAIIGALRPKIHTNRAVVISRAARG